MDWAFHESQIRFDIRAEREEYERLFQHPSKSPARSACAVRGGDRTKEIPVAEWERVYRKEAQERRLFHQARVLSWGKEKTYYYAHKRLH